MEVPQKRGPGRPRKLSANTPVATNVKLVGPEEPIRQGKIAIVGCYPEHWDKAPFSDPSWEIWGFSRRNWKNLPRVDRWFELHGERKFDEYDKDFPGYKEYLNQPHVTLEKDFPKAELDAEFGSFFFHWGQAPWLMAYAITQKPKTIGLWGIECVARYDPQRYEVQHFLQVCRDRGIEIVIPEGCTLLEPRKAYVG